MLSFFLHTKIKQSNLLIEMQVTHGNYSDKPFLKDNIISSWNKYGMQCDNINPFSLVSSSVDTIKFKTKGETNYRNM